jgi:hypothetical protein
VLLQGSHALAPNWVLMRARLREEVTAERTPIVIAFPTKACDFALASFGADSRSWTAPVQSGVKRIADGALLFLANEALGDLETTRLLISAERKQHI